MNLNGYPLQKASRFPGLTLISTITFQDGSVAWEAKDFLIEQEQCLEVTIEQKVYHGKHTEEYKKEQKAAPKLKNKKKSKKKGKSKKDEL